MLFFKQKTAYELRRSLVGSEMCIRDSLLEGQTKQSLLEALALYRHEVQLLETFVESHQGFIQWWGCLLYTSDAADDLLCVALGGRRIL